MNGRPLFNIEWTIPLHHSGLIRHSPPFSPVPCEKRKESAVLALSGGEGPSVLYESKDTHCTITSGGKSVKIFFEKERRR